MIRDAFDTAGLGWAVLLLVAGFAVLLGVELADEPTLTPGRVILDMLDVVPTVLLTAGIVLLFGMVGRQRERQTALLRDIDLARLEGQRWRSEAHALLKGLGEAIEAQFSRWNLTEAEREVALLLLKGLSLKEAAVVRATTERTIRAHARAVYTKAGLTGRAALAAFFLEDLLAPIDGGDGVE
jgi:DNA-binding CsgD family transcriptional regulator